MKRSEYKICAPIHNPQAVWCVGLNYSDHCKEQNLPEPKEPLIFSKGVNAITGPNEPIIVPKIGPDVDLEAELAIIVGKSGKNIPREHAMEHIFGFTIANDVSELRFSHAILTILES